MNLTGRSVQPKQGKPKKTAAGKRHMAKVARLPCIICGVYGVEVHHCIHDRFGQEKASDFDTIPLCIRHHRIGPDAIHNGKETWEARFGKDYSYLPLVNQMLKDMT